MNNGYLWHPEMDVVVSVALLHDNKRDCMDHIECVFVMDMYLVCCYSISSFTID
jgi:hypothetical protein